MTRSNAEITADIHAFEPVGDDWTRLDILLEELWSDGLPNAAINSLFNIFERYPNDDGSGVFWSVIHGLEKIGGYEQGLVESILREPSHCGLIMANRLINSGQIDVNGTPLIVLLETVADDAKITHELRADAAGFAKHQRENTT